MFPGSPLPSVDLELRIGYSTRNGWHFSQTLAQWIVRWHIKSAPAPLAVQVEGELET